MDTGITHGIGWTRITIPGMPDAYATEATRRRTGDSVVILHDARRGISEHTLKMLQQGGESSCRNTLDADIGLRFFDEAAAFPEDRVSHHASSFYNFDATAWMKEVVDVPKDIDITLDHNLWKRRLHVIAKTIRKGVEADVRRKVDGRLPFAQAIEEHVRFFRRNCPKPSEGSVSGAACGAHLNAMLFGLTAIGSTLVEGWRRQVADRKPGDVAIPWAMIAEDCDLVMLTLRCSSKSATALVKATLKGGHTVEDDEQGTTIVLKQALPAAVLGALPGRKVGDVLDAPWLSELVIRTARPSQDGKTTIVRTAVEWEPMRVPGGRQQDDLEIIEAISRMVGPGKRIETCDEAALPTLSRLDPERLLITLSMMLDTRRMRLDDVGLPDWTLVLNGTTIQVERCPRTDIETLVDALRERLPTMQPRS